MNDFTDVNVHVFTWPFRNLPHAQPESLGRYLAEQGIRRAWVGSFEAVLHRDVDSVNERLARACRSMTGCLPFGTIQLGLPDWKEDLRRCHDRYGMPGIRLYPNYHQYALTDDRFTELLGLCERHGLIVQIVLSLEDSRTQHPLVRVPPVDPTPLLALATKVAGVPLVLLNAFREQPLATLTKLAAAPNVFFDLATLEGVAGIERTLPSIPASQLLFGSHIPFYYPSAAKLKLQHAAISQDQRAAIARVNAGRILQKPDGASRR